MGSIFHLVILKAYNETNKIKGGVLMKALKLVLTVFALTLTLFAVSNIEASEYLGDYCWSAVDGSGNDVITKLGVFHMGGGHYQLLGTAKTINDGTYVVHGNAEIIDNEIHAFTVMADGNNNAMGTGHALAVLNPSTLNGSYNMLHTGANQTQSEIRYSTGTMTSIPCNDI